MCLLFSEPYLVLKVREGLSVWLPPFALSVFKTDPHGGKYLYYSQFVCMLTELKLYYSVPPSAHPFFY